MKSSILFTAVFVALIATSAFAQQDDDCNRMYGDGGVGAPTSVDGATAKKMYEELKVPENRFRGTGAAFSDKVSADGRLFCEKSVDNNAAKTLDERSTFTCQFDADAKSGQLKQSWLYMVSGVSKNLNDHADPDAVAVSDSKAKDQKSKSVLDLAKEIALHSAAAQ